MSSRGEGSNQPASPASAGPAAGADGGRTPGAVSPVAARQGVTGHNVRHVLGFGLGAIIIAFVIIYIIYWG